MENFSILTKEEMEDRYRLLHYRVQCRRLAEVWEKFESAGFHPILIKGWAAAQLYPQPYERDYTDIDLVFSTDEYERAEAFVRENTFNYPIDLHREARHLDCLPFADLFQNSVLQDCEGVLIRTLREEDHLRVLCVHWLNDGGANRERLRDIRYAIENRARKFDWGRFLETVPARRRRWLVCAVGLAQKYENLDLRHTPLEDEARNLPKWLERAVQKEWASDVRLIPLQQVTHDKKALWEQIKKRIPPNPVQATIELDGDFDKYPRFFYQFGDIFWRIPESIRKFRAGKIGYYENLLKRKLKI